MVSLKNTENGFDPVVEKSDSTANICQQQRSPNKFSRFRLFVNFFWSFVESIGTFVYFSKE